MENYTKEQVEDIKEREKKGLKALKELQLTPAASLYKVSLGDDTFADKVTPYIRDTKYVLQGDKYVEGIPSTDKDVNPTI